MAFDGWEDAGPDVPSWPWLLQKALEIPSSLGHLLSSCLLEASHHTMHLTSDPVAESL